MKYGRQELLILGTSSLCKLPPPNLTDLPAAGGKWSSGQTFIQEERKNKKKKRRKTREKKPYDPLNDNTVNPLFRKDDSKDQKIRGDNSNDELSKMVIDKGNNKQCYLQERSQKSGLGISHHLFHKAVADLTKQRN